MVDNMKATYDNCRVPVAHNVHSVMASNSSSDDGFNIPTSVPNISMEDAECSSMPDCRLKRYSSSPVLPFSSTQAGFLPLATDGSSVRIPIVGYEVMEERARFTVYKIKIENKLMGEAWFIFRRYTDFVRLHTKLRSEFPKKVLTLPRKRWFGNNFSLPFIEERIRGLQKFIDTVTEDTELVTSQTVRDFFCLDEPPSYSETGEESRAMFDALEDSIYHLRKQLEVNETKIINLRMSIGNAQEKAVTIAQKLQDMPCISCKDKVQHIADELQQVLCLQFSNPL